MTDAPIVTTLPPLRSMGMLDLDPTLFVAAGLFLLTMVLLTQLLFKPYLAILHERARLTTGAQDSAQATVVRATAALSDYATKIDAARRDAAAAREALRARGLADETTIVGTARAQAEATLKRDRDALAAAVAAAEQQVEQRSTALAQAIVAKVLA